VQLHSGSQDNGAAQLRARFGGSLRILRVIHFGNGAAEQLSAAAGDATIDGVLIDSRTATAVGGTGVAFDWQLARATIFTGDSRLKLIAAGGLTPANVADAIATLNPWGVDVASGVESAPGKKDPIKVREFVAHARGTMLNAHGPQ